MTKQLFEEALADVKKVRQVAEDNAKRALFEAVQPRIREFIDRALLQEDFEDEEAADGMPRPPGPPPLGNDVGSAASASPVDVIVTDELLPGTSTVPADAITPPDEEGKVTLDIDSLCSTEPGSPVPPPMFGAAVPDEGEEYEISLESIAALQPVIKASRTPLSLKDLKGRITKINERIGAFAKAGPSVRATRTFQQQIAQMIAGVEDMYGYVQESVDSPAVQNSYETVLEASFKALNQLQESTTMSQKSKKGQMNEADVTLKLTNLPDDIDLDTVGVDLITGEDEEDMGGDEDAQGGDDADLGDLDFGGDQGSTEGEDTQMETRRLSDDTIVEIDEKMLRREIARLRNLREDHTGTGGSETKAQSWGNGADNFDSFGGGKDDGAALDAEIVDKSPAPAALPLGEGDGEDLEEQDELDESDDLDEGDELEEMASSMDQIGNRSNDSTYGPDVAGGHATATWDQRKHEGLKRLAYEKKLQERAQVRAASLKKEAAQATQKRNVRRVAEIKKEYALVAKRFNESLARAKKTSQLVAEATKKLQESRSNSAANRPADKATQELRKKLAETNLFNAKLLFTNKLLQNEQLTARQKTQVIKQLDQAKTVREAKLVYESLANTMEGASKSAVNENRDRTVIGSSSRTTSRASAQTLNEGYEAERWAKLAGINK